jgi:hypothetical protein
MYRALFEQFGSECVGKLWRGEQLTDTELAAFRALLDAREASGNRLLGKYAGPDECVDTVSGRCGAMPLFR